MSEVQLPLSQPPIFTSWYYVDGGIAVTARTDDKGQAFIGHHPVDNKGMPAGRPIEYPRNKMRVGIVAG